MQKIVEFQIHENERLVEISVGAAKLEGILGLPQRAAGVVLFAHGTGSGRLSPRNNYVARVLREAGFGTLLMDLLMVEETEDHDKSSDMEFIARRILLATEWLADNAETKELPVGYFGSSAGAAAALVAAAQAAGGIPVTGDPGPVAVVSRGGRPDLAGPYLSDVKAPTLLIVGSDDEPVTTLNKETYLQLRCEKELVVIPGATHLFEEPGALEEVARLASEWFKRYLPSAAGS